MNVPPELLAAFRADEREPLRKDGGGGGLSPESMGRIVVLLIDDGFEIEIMRVLEAWSNAEHHWKMPKPQCPDNGRPTPRAWAWLWSGYRMDVAAIAAGANVTREVAREKLEVLKHNRLIYPDGSLAAVARSALAAHAARALGGGKPPQKKRRGSTPSAPSGSEPLDN